MKLNYIHHVGLIVKDLDRSIYFYHDIMGLKFQNEPTPWFEGPELEKGVNVPARHYAKFHYGLIRPARLN